MENVVLYRDFHDNVQFECLLHCDRLGPTIDEVRGVLR